MYYSFHLFVPKPPDAGTLTRSMCCNDFKGVLCCTSKSGLCTSPMLAKLCCTHYVATVTGIWQHLWIPQTSTMSMTLPIQSGCFHASVMSGNQIEAFERKPLTSVNLWYHIMAHSITRFGSVSGTGSTSNDVSTLSSMSSECFPPCVWNDHELSLDMWLASPSQGLLDDFLCHPRHPRAKCVRQNAQLAASCTQIILNSSSHKNQLAAMAHWCPNLYWYIYVYLYIYICIYVEMKHKKLTSPWQET